MDYNTIHDGVLSDDNQNGDAVGAGFVVRQTRFPTTARSGLAAALELSGFT